MTAPSSPNRRDNRPLVEKATSVVKKLRMSGFEAYFAGGCVRDRVMGRQPKDFDIATSATPEEVQELFAKTIAIGARFGVIQVRYGGEGFEVATFRTEGGYTDGRRPDHVEYATAIADVERRDFTINGLLFDPLSGDVLDYVGGVADIERGLIRAIGVAQKRFTEDRLRILRGVRFAARFQFAIESDTLLAIQEQAPAITQVSVERIREELMRILAEGGAAYGLELLAESQLLPHVLPECELTDAQSLARASKLLEHGRPNDPIMQLSTLLATATAAQLSKLTKRLKFSNSDGRRLILMSEQRETLKRFETLSRAEAKRLVRQEHFADTLYSAQLIARVDGEMDKALHSCATLVESLEHEDLWPPTLLTGNDLKQMGYTPGPHFKRALEGLEDAQLEGAVTSREQALCWVEELLGDAPNSPS